MSDLRRQIEESTLKLLSKAAWKPLMYLMNETNYKASEFLISVSKRKLSREMTEQQHSKRQMSEYTPLTGQSTEPQHRRISNRLLEMHSVKPSKSCSTRQGYKIVHSDTLSYLVTSSTPLIQCKKKKKKLEIVSDRHITSWAERISELVLPQLWIREKVFFIMLLWI